METLESNLSQRIIELLQQAIQDKNKAKLLLSGGNTPRGVYSKLSRADIDWKNKNARVGPTWPARRVSVLHHQFLANNPGRFTQPFTAQTLPQIITHVTVDFEEGSVCRTRSE